MTDEQFNRLLCKHEYEFVRNVYGVREITNLWGARSIWRCRKCGVYKTMNKLHD